MSVLQSAIAAASGSAGPTAYQIERSLRFNSADSAYLNWTPPQAGNRRAWTFSAWVKRSALGDKKIFTAGTGTTDSTFLNFFFGSADTLRVSGYSTDWLITTQVFRDLSAWYHIMLVADTDNATAANRLRIYVNGAQITAFSTATYPTGDLGVNNTQAHNIGRTTAGANYNDGYMAEVNFIDGQALTPSSFGETSASTGVWIPKAYTGSYGNNGFYLPFNDNSTPANLGRNRQTLTADPYWNQTTLLLNGNQPSGVTDTNNNVFKDSSSNNFTITRSGATNNTTQGTFSPFSQTGWSNYFDGTGDYLTGTITAVNNTTMTMECWVWLNALDNVDGDHFLQVDNGANTNYTIAHNGNGAARFLSRNNTGGAIFDLTSANSILQTNKWHHIVGVRNASAASLYVDGTRVATVSSPTVSSTDGTSLSIAYNNSSSPREPNGYISNARIVSGTAVYDPTSSSLTVPTSPLTAVSGTRILTCQSNRFVDNSGNNVALTVTGTPSVQAFSPFAPTAAYSAVTNGGSGYFDGTGDYLSIARNSAFFPAANTDFTFEAWIYPTATPGAQGAIIVGAGEYGLDSDWDLDINSSLQLAMYINSSPATAYRNTTATVRLNAWNHVAASRSGTGSNNLKVFVNGVGQSFTTNQTTVGTGSRALTIGADVDGNEANYTGYISGLRLINGQGIYTADFTPPTSPPTTTSGGVTASNTVLLASFTNAGIIDSTGKNALETVGNTTISTAQSKFGGSSMYFDGTGDYLVAPAGPGFDFGTGDFTIEMWIYPNTVSSLGVLYDQWAAGSGSFVAGQLQIQLSSTAKINFDIASGSSTNQRLTTTTSITVSTWTHIAIVRSGTGTGNIKVYINGTADATTITHTTQAGLSTRTPALGVELRTGTGTYYNGYIDDLRITKGYARYTGNFTVPAAQFAYNTADINVKQWTPNNFSVTAGVGNDSLVDSPTNYGTDTGAGGEVRGNYVTLNPLDKGSIDLVNGNLDFQRTSSTTDWEHSRGTIQIPSSGKWYWEVTFNSGTTDGIITGVCPSTFSLSADLGAGSYTNVYAWGTFPFLLANNSNTSYGTSPSAGGVIMCAFDRDNSKIYFGLNGTWFNSSNPATQVNPAASSIPADMFPFCGSRSTGNGSANFGQRPFQYTAPSGFKALCTQNLPTPAIGASASTLASKNFNVATYTGNGTTTGNTQAITGVSFQPDLVWIKSRSSGTQTHLLTDAVRGANKLLYSPLTDAEATVTNVMNSFDSDGFTVAYNSSYTAARSNENAVTYVGWSWKANGAGSSNTAGTLSSTVSVNTAAGISIVAFAVPSGTSNYTVGHGLGVAPAMIITKGRGSADNWVTFHKSVCTNVDTLLRLNTTGAAGTLTNVWGSSLPDSSVFGIKVGSTLLASQNAIAYCFAEVPGFSAFGKYTGNGSTDGPFVYCGFRPRWIMIKNSSAVANWTIVDTSRNPYNVANARLFPSNADAENTAADNVDILSNGFKVRNGTDTGANTSGSTYIFAAFAESPFQYSRAR